MKEDISLVLKKRNEAELSDFLNGKSEIFHGEFLEWRVGDIKKQLIKRAYKNAQHALAYRRLN